LLEAGADKKGRKALAEKTEIDEKLILKWVNHADLFRINGVAGQYAELLEAGADKKGRKALAEKTEIDEKLILKWVNHADLFRINGVAGQYAELLEASGVDTVKELRNRVPANLAAKMAEVNAEKNLTNKVPSETQVEKWVEEAKSLDPKVSH
jgi:hypothetical protein